jgi:hypothetical protein
MKASIVSALLFGSLATALFIPFERRDIDDVIVTVTSTTTIYIDPASVPTTTDTSVAPTIIAAVPTTVAEAAATTPSPPVVAAEQPAAYVYTPPAPTSVYTPPAPTPTPTPPAAAAPVAAPAAAPVGAATAGGSGGFASGTGDITYYEVGVGATSCGGWFQDTQAIVALPIGVMQQYNPGNPNNNPLCGKTVTITYNGVTHTGTVADSCGGCDSQSIDLSPSLFTTITGGLGAGRVSGVTWSVN